MLGSVTADTDAESADSVFYPSGPYGHEDEESGGSEDGWNKVARCFVHPGAGGGRKKKSVEQESYNSYYRASRAKDRYFAHKNHDEHCWFGLLRQGIRAYR